MSVAGDQSGATARPSVVRLRRRQQNTTAILAAVAVIVPPLWDHATQANSTALLVSSWRQLAASAPPIVLSLECDFEEERVEASSGQTCDLSMFRLADG